MTLFAFGLGIGFLLGFFAFPWVIWFAAILTGIYEDRRRT